MRNEFFTLTILGNFIGVPKYSFCGIAPKNYKLKYGVYLFPKTADRRWGNSVKIVLVFGAVFSITGEEWYVKSTSVPLIGFVGGAHSFQ